MILLIDNYDSFVHNLARFLTELGEETHVIRNDSVSVETALGLGCEIAVLSPGPGRPTGAGISTEFVRRAPSTLPILGVCLGHQCVAEAFGGSTVPAPVPVHGKLAAVRHDGNDLFTGIPSPFLATRYHSLVVLRESLADPLRPLAWTDDDILMAFRHSDRPIWGVQFHPEALLTQHGHALLGNFLALGRGEQPVGTAADLPGSELAVQHIVPAEPDPSRRR
ncbi:MAG: aminodeoxychorismate/anthranilate synthase component II [Gemmatimonadota bacterium]|nr:aminodeoxychorismate/anthranilate synthase component II [Gemmatimonadota bacterium]